MKKFLLKFYLIRKCISVIKSSNIHFLSIFLRDFNYAEFTFINHIFNHFELYFHIYLSN